MTKSSLGERLRAERERLGYTQPEFAEIVGASKRTQIGWEQGRTAPDALALAAWANEGLNVEFVVSGKRSGRPTGPELPPDEQLLLEVYRAMSAAKRKELLASLLTGGSRRKASSSGSITVTGNGNRTAGQVYHERKE
ncbi:TPA: helix-turn-helix domain-containing protein [Pseudomonas aeruginosa]